MTGTYVIDTEIARFLLEFNRNMKDNKSLDEGGSIESDAMKTFKLIIAISEFKKLIKKYANESSNF